MAASASLTRVRSSLELPSKPKFCTFCILCDGPTKLRSKFTSWIAKRQARGLTSSVGIGSACPPDVDGEVHAFLEAAGLRDMEWR